MSKTEQLIHVSRAYWDLHSDDGTEINATAVGDLMVEFAIRSLSTMAFRNPSIQIQGLAPYLGTSLEVYWSYTLALCACIVAVQLALSGLVYIYYVKPPESGGER